MMRLYAAVAVFTFVGGFAVCSSSQMFRVVPAIGGSTSGRATSYLDNLKSYNPLTLLNPGRLREIATSNAGVPRMEAVRSRFNVDALSFSRARAGTVGAGMSRPFSMPPAPQVRFQR
jgi:hypothetical protein